jgi:arylsulfatase A
VYFFLYRDPKWEAVNIPDLDDGHEGDYLTDRLTDEAVDFIERQGSRPFVLVVSHYAVHTPLQAKTDLSAKYEAKAAALFGKGPAPGVTEHEATTRIRQDDPVYAGRLKARLDAWRKDVRAAMPTRG